MSSYQPGYCNIGRQQRRRRFGIAVAAFAVAVGYTLACVVGPLPRELLIGVFVPLSIGFEWGIQAYAAFCVRLAFLNRYDFRGDGGHTGTVSDSEACRTDRLQAVKITAVAVAAAAITTGLLVVVL